MTDQLKPFSGFSVRDVTEAADYYREMLGLDAQVDDQGMGRIELGDGHFVLFYPKGEAHEPASFTVLNLPDADVTRRVADLRAKGVHFLRYEGMPQDDDFVMRGHGPDIAWFSDPSDNVFSIIGA